MIEKTVIDYLKTKLSVEVGAQTPTGPPGSYVVVEKTGASEKNGIRAAVLAMRCTAPSLYQAIGLCANVYAAMKKLPENEVNVAGVRMESEYNQTDTRTKEYRYTGVWRVYYTEDEP